jgi:hypothetical protein
MKKIVFILIAFSLCQLILAQTATVTTKGPEGYWKCSAPEAPYQYQSFNLLIEMANEKFTGKIVGEGGVEMQLANVAFKDSILEFGVYVENSTVPIRLKWDGTKLKGAAITDQGDIGITAERIEAPVKKSLTDSIPAVKTDTVKVSKK